MKDCLFCKIVAREIPADIFYEDNYIIAFLDINPINPGHALIVPKEHSQDVFDASDETLAAVAQGIKRLGPAIRDVVGADALNVGINNGAAAGQIIFHLHTHLIPRFKEDGYKSWNRRKDINFPDSKKLRAKLEERTK